MFFVMLAAVGIVFTWAVHFSNVHLSYFFDLPTLLILLLITAAALFQSGLWKDFNNSFRLTLKKRNASYKELRRAVEALQLVRKLLVQATVFITAMSIIVILASLTDMASLGPNLAVATLTALYGAFFQIIFLPMEKQLTVQLLEEDEPEEGTVAITEAASEGDKGAGA